MISLIWAMDRKRLIGNRQDLPWRIPADLAYFKKVTMGKPVIMGRKTFESIGKALSGRRNILLTRNKSLNYEGVFITDTPEKAIQMIQGEEAFVIGGAEIYRLFLPYASRLYITQIQAEFPGDVYFPDFKEDEWVMKERIPGVKDEKNPYDYEWLVYERKSKPEKSL